MKITNIIPVKEEKILLSNFINLISIIFAVVGAIILYVKFNMTDFFSCVIRALFAYYIIDYLLLSAFKCIKSKTIDKKYRIAILCIGTIIFVFNVLLFILGHINFVAVLPFFLIFILAMTFFLNGTHNAETSIEKYLTK